MQFIEYFFHYWIRMHADEQHVIVYMCVIIIQGGLSRHTFASLTNA